MRERNPLYVAPRIKLIMRKRYKLRRADKAGQADNIAGKINKLIAHYRSAALSGASNRDTKKLCCLLKQTLKLG